MPRVTNAAGIAAWILLLCLLVGLTLDHTHPYQGDETYYMKSAVGMLRAGDLLLPQYDGVVRLQKPILAYWMTALGYAVFGISLWAGRVPFLIAAAALLVAAWRLARLLLEDDGAARLAVALLSSSLLFLLFSRVSMTDLALALCSTAALLFLCRAVMRPGHARRDAVLAHLAMGMGFLAKGATALLPLAAVVAWLAVSRRRDARGPVRAVLAPPALAALALVVVPWHAYVWMFHRGEWLAQFTAEAADNLGPGLVGAASHVAFYAGALVAYQLPAAALAAWAWWKMRKSGERAAVPPRLGPATWFAALSLAVFVFAFAHHRDRYLLTIVPALCVWAAQIIHRAGIASAASRLAAAAALLQVAGIWIHGAAVGQPFHELTRGWEQEPRGGLAARGLEDREAAWLSVIAGGRLVPWREGVPYVIAPADESLRLPGYELLRRASLRTGLELRGGRPIVGTRDYALLGLRPPTPRAYFGSPGPQTFPCRPWQLAQPPMYSP